MGEVRRSERSGACEESGDDLVYPVGMGDRAHMAKLLELHDLDSR
jgi:2-methylisocitrate lyase-like PEP mutase family enzyme